MLRTHVVQRLRRRFGRQPVGTDNELALGRNRQGEAIAVAHHINHGIAYYRNQDSHAQHLRFADQHVAGNLRIVSHFVFLLFQH